MHAAPLAIVPVNADNYGECFLQGDVPTGFSISVNQQPCGKRHKRKKKIPNLYESVFRMKKPKRNLVDTFTGLWCWHMISEKHGCWPLRDVNNISMSWSIRAKFLMIGQKVRPSIWWKMKHQFYIRLSWTPWNLIKYYPLLWHVRLIGLNHHLSIIHPASYCWHCVPMTFTADSVSSLCRSPEGKQDFSSLTVWTPAEESSVAGIFLLFPTPASDTQTLSKFDRAALKKCLLHAKL